MAKRYVMTVLAANRVGMLAALANALDELGGNILATSQAVMDRFFTLIMSVEFPEGRPREVVLDHIQAVCRPFAAEASLKELADDDVCDSVPDRQQAERYVLTVSGPDRPGVLRRLAHRLAQDGIDVMDLQASRVDEGRLFRFFMEICVPAGVDIGKLARDLQEVEPQGTLATTLQRRTVLDAMMCPDPPRFRDKG